MVKTIAMLHYAGPPGVGGVEATIAHHARGLAALGYRVRVVSGSGAPFDARIETCENSLFGSTFPDVLAVKAELDAGKVTAAFEALVSRTAEALREALADADVCIAHNVPTLNKNLPLTAALARLVDEGQFRLAAWCHDLAWTNPQYLPELHAGYPWDLLRQAWDKVVYVTVSESRRDEMAALLNLPREAIRVVVPGVDPARFFRWTDTTDGLVRRLRLLDADGLLLVPARITRRKNLALGLRVVAALRQQSGKDYRLLVTGPPGPHNPANPGYLGELLELQQALQLEASAHFLYACGEDKDTPLVLDDDTVADLYRLCDALFFPSVQEGFGIPVLEAGMARLPAFCSDIPPFRTSGLDDVTYFDPLNDTPEAIAAQILRTLEGSRTHRLRARVRQSYRWEAIIREQLVPIVEGQ